MDVNDPGKLYVQFDRKGINERLIKGKSLPSCWMEEFQTIQPAFDKEIDAWIDQGSALLLKSVEIGDLRNAQRLFNEDKLIVDAARNADGRTILHVACLKGHKDSVRWLLDSVKADLEELNNGGFRAIHHSILEYHLIQLIMVL